MSGGRQAGFTLLETLVALVVLGLLMTGLAQGLRLGVNAWQAQTRILAARGDLDASDSTLRALIARLDPGGFSANPPSFAGSSRSLGFTTTLPQAAGGMATREADVTLAVDDGRRLQLLWRTHYPNPTRPPPPARRVLLLEEVDHLEIAYWQGEKGGWRSEWAGAPLPKLIRIRIVFTRESGRHGPDIVITPMRERWRQ